MGFASQVPSGNFAFSSGAGNGNSVGTSTFLFGGSAPQVQQQQAQVQQQVTTQQDTTAQDFQNQLAQQQAQFQAEIAAQQQAFAKQQQALQSNQVTVQPAVAGGFMGLGAANAAPSFLSGPSNTPNRNTFLGGS